MIIRTGRYQITIDDEDYDKVSKYSWSVAPRDGSFYARSELPIKRISMHRLILGLNHEDKRIIDHINGNGLDNRKCNLRIATHRQNSQNKRRRSDKYKTPYKGVSMHNGKARRKFFSRIFADGVRIYLGSYYTAEEAAMAYNEAAKRYFGEFACLNEIK